MAPNYRPRKKSKYSTIWTSKEDRLLRELKEVQRLGWREMSSYFEERTPNACQFRWRRLASGVHPKEHKIIDKPEEIEEIKREEESNPNSPTISQLSDSSPTSPTSLSPKSKPAHSINFLLN